MFVGSDIRSLKLSKELYLKLGRDGFTNYLTKNNDEYLRGVARIVHLYFLYLFIVCTLLSLIFFLTLLRY